MRVRKLEKSHLQKFKNMTKLSKEFGKQALKVYEAIDKNEWSDVEQVVELSGMDKETVLKIIEFMEKNGMLEVEETSVEQKEVEMEEIQPESIEPVSPETEEVKIEQEEAPGEIEIEEQPVEEIRPEVEVEEAPAIPEERQEETFTTYSEDESIVYSKYGEVGVRIYNAMKEGKSIRNIAIEEGLGEDEVREIANFLEEKGLLHEKPVEEVEEERFAPLSSEIEETLKAAEVADEDAIFEYKMKKMSFIDSIMNKFSIALKFKKQGRQVFEFLADGQEHDTLEIVKKLRIDIDTVENIIEELKKHGIVEEKKLNRQEIRKRYGYDSLAVYRKYGKRGVLMYDLVGRDLSLKEIARLAGLKDKEKTYEIFSFIHRLLGIEVPIDKSLIMKQLQ